MRSRPLVILTTRYYRSNNQKYLSNTLADEIRHSGKEVHVLSIGNVDFDGRVNLSEGSDIYIPFTSKIKYWKFIKLWIFSFWKAWKLAIELKHDYDLITFAPLSALFPVVAILRPKSRKSLCIVFDIFPEHQRQLGYISKTLSIFSKRLEINLLKMHQSVTGMSPMNRSVISSYYGLKKEHVHVLNLWVNRSGENRKSRNVQISKRTSRFVQEPNSSKKIKLIFGGQLVAGRKFPVMLDFLKIIRERGLNLELSVYSSGELFQALKVANTNEHWIKWWDSVSRDEFRTIVTNADFGIAITDDQVNLPTIPSKIFEYLSTGTRVFCIIERASDIEEVISDDRLLCVNHFSFEENDLLKAENFLQSGENCELHSSFDRFRSRFSTIEAVAKIKEILADQQSRKRSC